MEKPGRNDPCWCGSGKKYKKCHIDFDEKIEEFEVAGHIVPSHEILKNAEQIEKIKESAKINMQFLIMLQSILRQVSARLKLISGCMISQPKWAVFRLPLILRDFPRAYVLQ